MSNQIKISFIIPAYNAEGVLTRSVDSILHDAAIGSVEVIIIENGSTDGTTAEATALMERYNSHTTERGERMELVRLLHSKKGVSNARNTGIENARGEWMSFVDADDRITEDGIHLMIHDCMLSEGDLIVYAHMAGNDRRGVVDGPIEYFTYKEDRVEKTRLRMIANPTRYMQAWGKLFRTSIARRYAVRFNPEISLSEDSDFVLRFTRHCRQIDFSSAVAYRYSVDIPSTIRAYDGSKAERFADALQHTKESVRGESDAVKKAFRQYILMNMNVVMVREVWVQSNPHTEEEKLAEEKRVAAFPIFEGAIRSTKLLQCHTPRMLPILCLKLHWYKAAAKIYKKRVKDNAKLAGEK